MNLTAIIAFIVVFGILVTVHEFGHFIMAKKSGVLVREFAIGMGPKILSWNRNHTAYTIRVLPVGGYVRMAGMDDEADLDAGQRVRLTFDNNQGIIKIDKRIDSQVAGVPFQVDTFDLSDGLTLTGYLHSADNKQIFSVDHDAIIVEENGTEIQVAPKDTWVQSAPVLKRALINIAGPFMNFVLALVVFIGLGFLQPQVTLNEAKIGTVESGMPAQKAGLKNNDQIVAINGQKMSTWEQVTTSISSAKKDHQLKFVIRRDGVNKSITVMPQYIKDGETKRMVVGITTKTYTDFSSRMRYGFIATSSMIQRVWYALTHLFTGGFSLNKLGGPVSIAKATSVAAQSGMLNVLAFMAMLSINLGIMNLIPIPALDGGKLILNVIEIILRRPLPGIVENAVTIAGAAFMFILMIAVTINDLLR